MPNTICSHCTHLVFEGEDAGLFADGEAAIAAPVAGQVGAAGPVNAPRAATAVTPNKEEGRIM